MTTRTLKIELPEQMWTRIDRLVQALPHCQTLEAFVVELLDHVQQGVYRSGAWEREWLTKCVGEEPVQKAHSLDEDPL